MFTWMSALTYIPVLIHICICIWRAELGVRYFLLMHSDLVFSTGFPTKHGAHSFGWAA